MADFFESHDNALNPLDNVEEILNANNWTFDRMGDDELIVEVRGKSGSYRLFFLWQAEMSAMQFCCQYDLTIPKDNYATAAMTLMGINETVWMGHFDLPHENGKPSYRHTCLFRGMPEAGSQHLEDMVDVALALCERYHPVFSLLSSSKPADTNLSLALMDTVGES